MHFIKRLISKYSAWIWAVLAPLGIWGVFAITFVDAALLGMPVDAVVAGYVFHRPHLLLLYVAMAAAGSAVGSMIIYFIGYKGGEMLLEKRIPKARFEKIKKSFEDHEFLALMLPAMLPPPAPFKLIVLSAAAFEMDWHKFMGAIFLGRVARFMILSILVLKFGPQVVSIVATLFRDHMAPTLIVIAGIVVLAVLGWQLKRRRSRKRDLTAAALPE